MYFFQLLLLMLPVVGLGVISMRWKRMALITRILLLTMVSGVLYTGAAWWLANDIYQPINPLARDNVMPPLLNALEVGLIASGFGLLTAIFAHFSLRQES